MVPQGTQHYTFSGGDSVSTRLLPLVCVKWRVFSKQQLIRPKFNLPLTFLVTLKEWLVLRDKLNNSQTNVGAKVQPHQPSLLIVFSSQMLKCL